MYTCQNCQKVVPSNVKINRVILATRSKVYIEPWSNLTTDAVRKKFKRHKLKKKINKQEYFVTGSGQEIVEEITVCADCAADLNGLR